MRILRLLVWRNSRWILAFAAIFIYASGILTNASSLSQWYSKKVTSEILGFANNDFVVSQSDMPEMVNEVHERLAALKDVRYVVSMVCLKMHLFTPRGSWGATLAYHANGTGIDIGFGGISFASFIGLDGVLSEEEMSHVTPKPGSVILSSEVTEVLGIKLGEDFKVWTPFGNITFQVCGLTDLDEVAIWYKIDNPRSPLVPVELPRIHHPLELFPAYPLPPNDVLVQNQLVLVSLKDAINFCNMFRGVNLPLNPETEILHYVFTERQNIVDSVNIDVSITNLKMVKERIEVLISDVPAKVDSLVLQCFESVAPGVNLFSVVTGGYMLAALPLYWFIASALVSIFAERKRREIALFKVKGMSTRKIASTYTFIVLISAVVGCALSALIQANAINILTKNYTGFAYEGTGITVFGIVLPDATSFLTLLALGLILAFLAVWNIIKSITSLQPVEAAGRLPQEGAGSRRLGKLPIVLLALGLVKVGLVLGGLNPTVYFKYSPPNPYVAMAIGLFAAFDLYALTALAPVFIAYGFAKIISTHSEKFRGLIEALSYLAGLGRRKVSSRLISSEMWRISAILLLVALLISYGIGSYVCNSSLTEHVWRIAGEFTGSDIRIDCLPNATQNIETMLKGLDEVLEYARIDVVTILLIHYRGGGTDAFHVSLMVIDPEQYTKTAYLDNSPKLGSILNDLKGGDMVGLKGGLSLKYFGVGREISIWYIPKANATFDTELYSNSSRWQEMNITQWTDLPLPGAIENPETIRISYSLRTLTDLASVPDEPVYPEILISRLYLGRFRFSDFLGLSYRMANYTQKGPLWEVGEFIATNETISDLRYLHYKTHFIIKIKGQTSANSVVSTLRSQFAENVIIITREEATSIITRSVPKITTGLAFTQMNSLLITAISFGGLAAITIANVTGRTKLFSLLRIRGARRIDGVAFFIPEVAFVSLMAGSLGVVLGLTLAVGFTNSLTSFIPPLFTGGSLQMILGSVTWLFLGLILATFATMYIIATFFQSKIHKSTD
jgi:hypothetical protein